MIYMTPEQCRAGRGWLGWSQHDLAERARVGLSTVRDFEAKRRQPITNNIAAMQRAFEAAGIRLVFGPSGEAAGIAWGETSGLPPTGDGSDDDE